MSFADSLTDDEIQRLLSMRKIVAQNDRKNPRWRDVNGHRRLDWQLQTGKDAPERFFVFARQSIDDQLDFTVGLKVQFSDGSSSILMRCNGIHGRHYNRLEHQEFIDLYHIHVATERYVNKGLDAEGYAEITNTYRSVNGALECLLSRCNIIYEDISRF